MAKQTEYFYQQSISWQTKQVNIGPSGNTATWEGEVLFFECGEYRDEGKLTGKFAGWGGEAAAVQGSTHEHDAHLLCGALEDLHVPIFHGLLMTLLGHHEGSVGRLHLDEGVSRGPALKRRSSRQNTAVSIFKEDDDRTESGINYSIC